MCEVKYIITLFAAQSRTSYYNGYQTIHGVLLCYIGEPVVLTVILSFIDLFNIICTKYKYYTSKMLFLYHFRQIKYF